MKLAHIACTVRVLAAWGVAAWTAHAASYRFDMGTDESPLAAGYARVTKETALASSPEFGWTRRPRYGLFRNGPSNPYYGTAGTAPEYALLSDGVLSIEENTFTFTVEPGRYAVTTVIGDLALDETRPGNSIWANGAQVASDVTTSATVKEFRFPIDAPAGRIELRYRADSRQKYVTVIAVTAEPLAPGAVCDPSMSTHPSGKVPPEVYRSNWEAFGKRVQNDWAQARGKLAERGVDFAYWKTACQGLRRRGELRGYFATGLGNWERIERRSGELSLEALCGVFAQIGMDGLVSSSPMVARELDRHGLLRAPGVGGEGFPGPNPGDATPNRLRKADGSEATVPGVWSNCAPDVIATFREAWRQRFEATAPGAAFLMIDEPRGMWYAGNGMGDYSTAAEGSFRRWAAGQGWTDLSRRGIPPRGRTLDFHRFYSFRLDSVGRFVEACVEHTPIRAEGVPVMPGNGNVGPEQMNHSCFWPPAMARRGFVAACWSYGAPATCKMHAETVKIAAEHGGEHAIFHPLFAGRDTPWQDLPRATACISALNTRVFAYHFGGVVNGPNRVGWMQAAYLCSRLTHATTDLVHTPPLYVWCPESIVYNDLVEFSTAEATNWRQVAQCLFDANLDYAVTNLLTIPKDAILLYACVRPVLSQEEMMRLERFVHAGGTVLCTFTRAPELPDGSLIQAWAELPKDRLKHVALLPDALEKAVVAHGGGRNWPLDEAAVKTYLYLRENRRVHLLSNTEIEAEVSVRLPAGVRDALTGKVHRAGALVAFPRAGYALLEEMELAAGSR